MNKRIINPSFRYKANRIITTDNFTKHTHNVGEATEVKIKEQQLNSTKILFKASLIMALVGGIIINWYIFREERSLINSTFPIGNIAAFVLSFVFFWFGVVTMLVPVFVVELFFGKEGLRSNDKMALSFLIFGGILGFLWASEQLGFAF